MAGHKLRVLALVFIAGQLELTQIRSSVLAVVADAMKQYKELSEYGKFNLDAATSRFR